jgi:DNA-binding CsgD family transcriptional regulator
MSKYELPLSFYKEALDAIQAGVYVNQIDDVNDFRTAQNIYINSRAIELAGYTLAEFEQMGQGFFARILHPEDLGTATESIRMMVKNPGSRWTGVARIITKSGKELWFYGTCAVLTMRNGVPWQFVNVIFDLLEPMNTEVQLAELLKENAVLKNKLRLSEITKREKEIIKGIVAGLTDKEIGFALNISPNTAKTHRKNILQKLSLNNTADLVRFAMETGLN